VATVGRHLSESDAWALTRALSPRPSVRVADVDVCGTPVNTYTRTTRIAGEQPGAPWALYLADSAGLFRLIVFDLDAGKGDPIGDAATLSGWLEHAGLPHVVAASGPSGGRHVWVALAEAVDAPTVDTLARLARARLSSLDLAPLSNPVTGCVRPPGAPHRHGGTSTVLTGDLSMLTVPTVTAADVARFVDQLASDGHRPDAVASVGLTTPLPVDAAGRLHLPGPRRELPAASTAALAEDAAAADASAVLWQILIGAAAARWRCADLAPLVDRAPGLEHLRSHGQGPGRQRRIRDPRESRRLLHRQWDNAVCWVATHPRAAVEDDPTFNPRAAEMVRLVERTQTRADTSGGRWAGPGGPADRRVLDALCSLMLHGLCTAVEADIRRLGLLCGIGRETARTALLRLSRDGWITCRSPGDGPRAATWSLSELSTPLQVLGRSQAVPPPTRAGSADRTHWLSLLREKLSATAHDVFTPAGGLGHATGQLYAALTDQPSTPNELSERLGYSGPDLDQRLRALRTFRLVEHTAAGWALPRVDRRTATATRLGVSGRLADRAQRYALEREAWAWWCAELGWMHASNRVAPNRRPGHAQLALLEMQSSATDRPPHPRRSDGRADFAAARRVLQAREVSRADVNSAA
jgi:hypothetical protein